MVRAGCRALLPAWAAAIMCLDVTPLASAGESRLPNVVILYADDMGPGDVAAANPDSKIPTPHIDRLCREGTRFTDAHSSSGICTPSRFALLHGRYHWHKFHGIVNSFDQPVMDPERTTLAEMLQSRGYRTACIGKWHLGWDWQAIRRPDVKQKSDGQRHCFPPDAFDWSLPVPGGPLAHGFDYYFGDDVPNFPPYAWFENDRIITPPHAPIVPAAEFQGRSQAGGYGDWVAQTDAPIGQTLDTLEAKGLADDTIVIFSADNGPEQYAYKRVRVFGHRSMGDLCGVKRDLWEGGHRVSVVVRWPGRVPAGRVEPGLMSQIDVFATLAAIVGAEILAGSVEDSLNQRALLTGTGPSVRDTLLHNTNPTAYAIRHRDWLLVDAKTGEESKMPRFQPPPSDSKPSKTAWIQPQPSRARLESPDVCAQQSRVKTRRWIQIRNVLVEVCREA
jgi:arylsulfatase A